MPAGRRALALLVPALLGLGACAKPLVPVAEAERYCSQHLSAPATGISAQPRVSVGIGSGGYRGGFVGLDFEPGQRTVRTSDPEAIFADCVRQRSGREPSKSLYQQPGWGAS